MVQGLVEEPSQGHFFSLESSLASSTLFLFFNNLSRFFHIGKGYLNLLKIGEIDLKRV